MDGWSDESSKAQRPIKKEEGGRKHAIVAHPPTYLPTYAYLDQSGSQLLAHLQGNRVTVSGELVGAGVEGHEQGQQLLHGGPKGLHSSSIHPSIDKKNVMEWCGEVGG